MNEEKSDRYIDSLDRRITEQEHKLSIFQRDITDTNHEVKEILGRYNNGVSPTMNAVKDQNAKIELELAELRHQVEVAITDMKTMTRESHELSTQRFRQHEKELDEFKASTERRLDGFENGPILTVTKRQSIFEKIFIYGPMIAVVLYLSNLAFGSLWKKMFDAEGKPVAMQATSTKKPAR